MNGFFNVLKPTGYTSSDVVVKLRNILTATLGVKVKIGHLGTLDPGGSGVLPIAVGNATKLFDEIRNSKKIYRAQAVLGVSTDTLDSYGVITEELQNVDLSLLTIEKIQEVLSTFIGKQMQYPPAFSAKNVNGKRAYDLARKGIDIDLKAQEIEIFDVKLIDYNDGKITFDLTCTGGTYVRSFVRDLGIRLGYPAYMSYIIRTYGSGFDIDTTFTLEDIEKDYKSAFISLEEYSKKYPKFLLSDDLKRDYGVGNKIQVPEELDVFSVYSNDEFLCIAKNDSGFLKKICLDDKQIYRVCDHDKLLFPQKVTLGLGYFDAVHLGHDKIIKKVKSLNGIPAIFTLKGSFGKYTDEELSKDLYSFEQRSATYLAKGIQKIFYQETTTDFLNTEPEEFLKLLVNKINVGALVCGPDYTFGKNGKGNVELLQKFCNENSINLHIVDILTQDGEKVSSSAIKKALINGDIPKVNRYLGYPYFVKGKVREGRKDGRKIGFPTLNVPLSTDFVLPKFGVYHTKIKIKGQVFDGVTNVGPHPTFKDDTINLETYLIGFDQDYYGKTIKIEFYKYLRPIYKFDTIEQLIDRIEKDVLEVKNERD